MLSSILDVFTRLFGFALSALNSVAGLFFYYEATSDLVDIRLTFFGVLALAGLGISIFFLLVRVVQNFLHFKS